MNICDMNDKPKVEYPIQWGYKVVINADEDINLKIKNIVKNFKYEVKSSKNSPNGKYKSYNIKVLVNSEKERLEIFNKLKDISKFVL